MTQVKKSITLMQGITSLLDLLLIVDGEQELVTVRNGIHMMKYLIFGGAFDPIHKGHLHKASYVRRLLGFNRVLIMPTYKNMFGKEMTPATERVNMLKQALIDHGDCNLLISEFETRNKLDKCTYDILKLWLSMDRTEGAYSYLIGGDQARAIDKWMHWEKLIKLIPFVVVTRDLDDSIPSLFYNKPHKVVVSTSYPISSTKIREQIRDGVEPEGLTPNTLNYIKRNKLYV